MLFACGGVNQREKLSTVLDPADNPEMMHGIHESGEW
jgi:hypothetical protein